MTPLLFPELYPEPTLWNTLYVFRGHILIMCVLYLIGIAGKRYAWIANTFDMLLTLVMGAFTIIGVITVFYLYIILFL